MLKTLNPEYEEDTAEEVQNLHLSPFLFLSLIHIHMATYMKVDMIVGTEVRKSPGFVLLIIFYSSQSDELDQLCCFLCKGNFKAEVRPWQSQLPLEKLNH